MKARRTLHKPDRLEKPEQLIQPVSRSLLREAYQLELSDELTKALR